MQAFQKLSALKELAPTQPELPSILKGPDGIDGYAIHARDAESGANRIAGQPLRVGWVTDAAFGPVDPEITAAVAAAAVQLADLGCIVEEVTLPFLGNPFGTMATLVYGEIVPSIKALSAGREDQLHAIGAGMIAMSDPSFADFASRACSGRDAPLGVRRLLPEV